MVNNKEIVFEALIELGIEFDLFEHPPIPTIDDARKHWSNINAFHCKNLFFRNHKGNSHFLVVFDYSKQLSIKDLEQRLKQGKLSFASEKRTIKYLQTIGGSISPFGLLNDNTNHVHLFLDENILKAGKLSFHPNDNTKTVVIRLEDFIKYLDWIGNSFDFIKLY